MKKGFACQQEEEKEEAEAESKYFKEDFKGGQGEEERAWQYVYVRCDISLIIILFVFGKLRN